MIGTMVLSRWDVGEVLPEVRLGRLVQVSERWEWLFGLSVAAMAYAIGGIRLSY